MTKADKTKTLQKCTNVTILNINKYYKYIKLKK